MKEESDHVVLKYSMCSEASGSQILIPWLGDIVDAGIGLTGVPARQPNARVDYIPWAGTKNLASGLFLLQILLPGDSPQDIIIR